MSRRLALLAGLFGLSACQWRPAEENQGAAAAGNAGAPVSAPAPARLLDRTAVLLAVVRARSAAAAGMDDASLQRELDGERFEFRIRLGCALAAPGTEAARATFDPEARRVAISARPELTLEDPAVAAAAAGQFEAAEGFRLAAPWLLVPSCAGRRAAPAPVVPGSEAGAAEAGAGKAGAGKAKVGQAKGRAKAGGGQTSADATGEAPLPAEDEAGEALPQAGAVGLVQFFTAADPRGGRRDGRAYAARETLPEGSAGPEPGSWELVLTGRLQALPSGRVIACHPAGAGVAPACIVSVRFDRVAIVNRVSGEQLAEWSGG